MEIFKTSVKRLLNPAIILARVTLEKPKKAGCSIPLSSSCPGLCFTTTISNPELPSSPPVVQELTNSSSEIVVNRFIAQGHRSWAKPHGDKLVLRGLRFHGHHGVFEEERKLGQKFIVDVDAWLDLQKAGETDQLEHSVSYAEIYRKVKSIVEGPPHTLLESVANAIALEVLRKYPMISDVCIRVGKPHVAVEGMVDFLGVEIFRHSSQVPKRH